MYAFSFHLSFNSIVFLFLDDDTVLKSRYHGELSYSRLSEPRRPAEREWESYSVSRSNYDSQKTEPIRDYDYNEDKITKSESMR